MTRARLTMTAGARRGRPRDDDRPEPDEPEVVYRCARRACAEPFFNAVTLERDVRAHVLAVHGVE